MAKSDKLYDKSPRLKRDKESGEMGIHKPTEADAENMGVAGNPLPTDGSGEIPMEVHQAMASMHDRHSKEMKDMHKRHEDEHKDMHKRHQKEVKHMMKKDSKEEE
jgi:hypothetical protein